VKTELSPGAGSVVHRGDTIRYRVSISAGGGSSQTNIRIDDVLPTFVSLSSQGDGTNAGSGVNSRTLFWRQSAISPGGTLSVEFTVVVNANAPDGGQICNSASVQSSQLGSIQSNIVCNTITVPPPPPATGCINVVKETFDSAGNRITPVGQFSFQLDGGTIVSNDSAGSARFDNISVGSHTVSEINIPSGWTLISTTPASGHVTVPAGNNCATVVFKNQQNTPPPTVGCINVVKETFDSAGHRITPVTPFTFQLDGLGTSVNDSNGNARFDNVSPGAHTVSEINIPSGWTLLSTTPGGGAITVPAGNSCATVVFKNQQTTTPPPTTGCIEVHKETFDTAGTRLTPVAQFTFRLDGSGTAQNDSTGVAMFLNVPVGAHTISEIVPDTWQQTSIIPEGGVVNVESGNSCAQVTIRNQQVVPGGTQPPVCTLVVLPTLINLGGSATLTWTTQNATSASMNQGIGSVALNGSMSVSPSTNATYTLTAIGLNGGTVSCSAALAVQSTNNAGGGGGTNNNTNTNNNNNSNNNSGNSTNTNTNNNTVSPNITVSPDITVNVPEQPYFNYPQIPNTYQPVYPYLQPQYPVSYSPPQYPQYASAASVPLSSIPYTGFDGGLIGNILFWLGLVSMSFMGAYLIVYYKGGVMGFMAPFLPFRRRFARGN
jgi:hypothetical protein